MSSVPLKSVDQNENQIASGKDDDFDDVRAVSTFRRVLPQLFGCGAKNLMILNIGQFFGFATILIPALTGISNELNPNETVQITAAQASWLSMFAHLAHPIGSLLSAPINDKIGRRKTLLLVNVPLTTFWIILGCSQSFPLICCMFALLGFCFGLKEAPSLTYISEISEPSMRGILMTITSTCFSLGHFSVMAFGSILPWRLVAFICALSPICCFIAICFVPESPSWLLSKGRTTDAQKSLQWLRGWVDERAIREEFSKLQNYNNVSTACQQCAKQSIRCYHARPTFCDKIKEIKRRRNMRPLIIMLVFYFCYKFNGSVVLEPYNIQVFKALGAPIEASMVSVLASGVGLIGGICFIMTVRKFGRRKLYLTSVFVTAVVCIGLSIYGFILFPSGWISFKRQANEPPIDSEHVKSLVGNLGYFVPIAFVLMRFFTKTGIDSMPAMYSGEVFPFKTRSFLCGIATASNQVMGSISTKIYYNIEMWLSLPGAILFYGIIGLIGLIVMYFIMPETEQRSLEDIELYFSDNTKGITDIYIPKSSHKETTNKSNEHIELTKCMIEK